VRTGGSVLGDKTRMTKLAQDDRAFVRPTASGGSLGGVARRTRAPGSSRGRACHGRRGSPAPPGHLPSSAIPQSRSGGVVRNRGLASKTTDSRPELSALFHDHVACAHRSGAKENGHV